jgi:hypothetical protein
MRKGFVFEAFAIASARIRNFREWHDSEQL